MSEINLDNKPGVKVLFLPLGNAACVFYRMLQFADKMGELEDIYPIYPKFDYEKDGTELRPYERWVDEHIAEMHKLFRLADVVVCQMIHNMKFWDLLKVLRDIYKIPVVMECDDSPYHVHGDHYFFKDIGVGSGQEQGIFEQSKEADALIVSTEYLKNEFMMQNKNISVVPNCLNFDIWNFPGPKEKDEVVIGWAGAYGHRRDLSLIHKACYEILSKYKNVKIKFLHGDGGKEFLFHENYEHDKSWSNIVEYPVKLNNMNFDIAIAPLWDSEFNRCKSNLRFLEYSALGVATVASRVEPYKQTIVDGVTGFFASTTKEWVDKLSFLIDNKLERFKIAKNAHDFVRKNFDLTSNARDYADLLKVIINKYRSDHADVNLQAVAK